MSAQPLGNKDDPISVEEEEEANDINESIVNIKWRDASLQLPLQLQNTTLAELKRLLEANTRVPMSAQRIAGIPLLLLDSGSSASAQQERWTLATLGVKSGDTLELLTTLDDLQQQQQSPVAISNSSSAHVQFGANWQNQSGQHGNSSSGHRGNSSGGQHGNSSGSMNVQQTLNSFFPQMPPNVPQSPLIAPHYEILSDQEEEEEADFASHVEPNSGAAAFSLKNMFFEDPKMRAQVASFMFENCVFDEAFDTAKQQYKMLIVVLYSSADAANSLKFCSELLTSNAAMEIISEQFIIFFADSNNNQISTQLQSLRRMLERNGIQLASLSALPLICLVSYMEGSISLVDRIDGYVSVDTFIMKLFHALEVYGPILDNMQAHKRIPPQNVLGNVNMPQMTLMDEQDVRYREAMKRDMELLAKKQQEEDEKKKQLEILEKKRHEELAKQQAYEQLRAQKAQSLPEEPSAQEQDTATLRFRLPNGEQRERRFRAMDTIGLVYDFLLANHNVNPETHHIMTNFPNKAYDYEAYKNVSIKDAELYPRANLFVREKP